MEGGEAMVKMMMNFIIYFHFYKYSIPGRWQLLRDRKIDQDIGVGAQHKIQNRKY